MLEHAWWAARAASWFPGWLSFQAVAVVVGALLAVRGGGRRLLVPYAVGVVLAAAGALALGSGGTWGAWARSGARGPLPELEIAGFGAIAGLVIGYVVVARARGIAARPALDTLAAPLGAMIAIARTGCFFAGCDFGRPTSLPLSLAYPPVTPAFRAQLDAGLIQASAARTLPVHPTQLYEAAVGLVVLLVAVGAAGRLRRAGDRFVAAALIYAAGRMLVDVFRGDLTRGGSLGLTTTQALALALMGAMVAWRFSAAPPSSRRSLRSCESHDTSSRRSLSGGKPS